MSSLYLQDRARHIPGFGRQHSSDGGGISSPFPIRSSTFIRTITARRTNRCAQCICHPVLQPGHASSMLLAKPFLLPVMKKCTAPSPSVLLSIQVGQAPCELLLFLSVLRSQRLDASCGGLRLEL